MGIRGAVSILAFYKCFCVILVSDVFYGFWGTFLIKGSILSRVQKSEKKCKFCVRGMRKVVFFDVSVLSILLLEACMDAWKRGTCSHL